MSNCANDRLVSLVSALLIVAAGSVTAQVVYEEDFSSDPGWLTSWTPGPTEFAHHTGDAYAIRVNDGHSVFKYAYTNFPALDSLHTDYCVKFDFRFTDISWGQGIDIRLHDLSNGWQVGGGMQLSYVNNSAHGGIHHVGLSDGGDPLNSYLAPQTPVMNTWYRFELLSINNEANWVITNLANQTTFWEEVGQAWSAPAFDTVSIGNYVIWGEGDHAGVEIDNIMIEVFVVAVEQSTLTAVKALFK